MVDKQPSHQKNQKINNALKQKRILKMLRPILHITTKGISYICIFMSSNRHADFPDQMLESQPCQYAL